MQFLCTQNHVLALATSCLNMADPDAASVNQAHESSEKKDYNPRLDFFSEHFDPLLALTTPGVLPPQVNAPVYDNLDKYQSVQNSQDSSSRRRMEASAAAPRETETFERKWLPHQSKYKIPRYIIWKSIGCLQIVASIIGAYMSTY